MWIPSVRIDASAQRGVSVNIRRRNGGHTARRKPTQDEGRTLRLLFRIVAFAFLLGAGGWVWHAYSNLPQDDPLCVQMRKSNLFCVANLVGEDVLGPGQVVELPKDYSQDNTRVSRSTANLFGDSCVVPGAGAVGVGELLSKLRAESDGTAFVIAEINYIVNRSAGIGAEVQMPKVLGVDLKAGPEFKDARTVSLKVKDASLKQIDEFAFIQLLSDSAVKSSCIDRIIQKEYAVIQTAAVAKSTEMTVRGASGAALAFSATTKKSLESPAGASAAATSQNNLDSLVERVTAKPLVMGVGFFASDAIRLARARLVAPRVVAVGSVGEQQLARVSYYRPGVIPCPRSREPEAVLEPSVTTVTPSPTGVVDIFSAITATLSPGIDAYRTPVAGVSPGACREELVPAQSKITARTHGQVIVRDEAASEIVLRGDFDSVTVRDPAGQTLPTIASSGAAFRIRGAGVYSFDAVKSISLAASQLQTFQVESKVGISIR